jgi:hypothetical protein
MQRRTHHPPVAGRDGKSSSLPDVPKASHPPVSRLGRSKEPVKNGAGLRLSVLLLIAFVLSVVIYLFPENRKMAYETEQRLEQVAYEAEQRLEHDLIDWFGQQPPVVRDEQDAATLAQLRDAANARMKNQGSQWVDSEKKLKNALKVLVARQAEGKDLGVPVLTRWLGDDVPAFAGEGVNVEEWNQRVEQKYAEMRVEEEQWREMITASLATNARG